MIAALSGPLDPEVWPEDPTKDPWTLSPNKYPNSRRCCELGTGQSYDTFQTSAALEV